MVGTSPRHRVRAVTSIGAVLLALVCAYGIYSRSQSHRRPTEPTPRAGGATPTLTRLAALTRASPGACEPASGVVSEQFLADMTPEVLASDPWTSSDVSMSELLDIVERCRRVFVRSPQLFGAMSFAVEESGLREGTLRRRACRLLDVVRTEFIDYHRRHTVGFQAPPAAWHDTLNPFVPIRGGDFMMGSADVFARVHRVRLSNYAIQQHEVTNEEYRRFDPAHSFPAGREKHPVDSVDWYSAQGYAAWLGGSLPTEAQWEFAARGKHGRRYPWGDGQPTRERANFFANDSKPGSEPVGSHPKGSTPEGIQDLAGNVWEWCRDWFAVYPPASELALDPLGPAHGTGRVLRGGSYFYDATLLRAAFRNNDLAGSRYLNFGFRVAITRPDP
jgi:formylglycine-generating enzyme required for sulfatase activity